MRGHSPPPIPLGDIPAFLARPQTLLSPSDAALLTETFDRLTGDLAAAAAPGQMLHGDAGRSNLMAAGGQWVWHDFEDTCSGPVAWDLAATTQVRDWTAHASWPPTATPSTKHNCVPASSSGGFP